MRLSFLNFKKNQDKQKLSLPVEDIRKLYKKEFKKLISMGLGIQIATYRK